jgi:hypothetical protein
MCLIAAQVLAGGAVNASGKVLVVPANSTKVISMNGATLPSPQPGIQLPYQVRGTRTDIGQVNVPAIKIQLPGQISNQRPVGASMSLPNKDADARSQQQYQACKEYVKQVKGGAYDGRWSGGAPGQVVGFGKMNQANKIGEQCPPELLKSRSLSEWEK